MILKLDKFLFYYKLCFLFAVYSSHKLAVRFNELYLSMLFTNNFSQLANIILTYITGYCLCICVIFKTMAAYIICLTSGSGLPVFTRSVGNVKPVSV